MVKIMENPIKMDDLGKHPPGSCLLFVVGSSSLGSWLHTRPPGQQKGDRVASYGEGTVRLLFAFSHWITESTISLGFMVSYQKKTLVVHLTIDIFYWQDMCDLALASGFWSKTVQFKGSAFVHKEWFFRI